jgi:hypothetical protein
MITDKKPEFSLTGTLKNAKKESLEFQFEIEPYKRFLMVFYKPSWERVAEFYIENGLQLPDKEEIFRDDLSGCVTFQNGNWILFLHNYENLVSTVTHECCHIALNLFSYIGEDKLRTYERNEPFCYLVESLVKKVIVGICE